MVTMPPGSAKSVYASQLFPGWYLAQESAGNVIAGSHTVELAERFGRKVRNFVSEHSLPLGVGISSHSSAAGRWETTRGQEYYAAGVGVGIAGFRAKLALIDDPVRSREDADSKLARDRVWDWYNDDLDTRLVPGASQALIMTRWHDDDLAGRLLAREADQWDVLKLPAIAGHDDPLGRKPGEWLWDGEYGYAGRLKEKRQTSDDRSWSALYQQEPTPESGDFFRREWFKPYDKLPPIHTLTIYGASDYAVTANGGDYTVHVVIGIDPQGSIYVLDLWRKQADSAEWVESWCDLVRQWKPLTWAEEQGQIRAGIGPFLEQRARARQAFCHREKFPTRGDKAVRAQSIRGRMSMGGLYVPAGADWTADLIAECLRFPAGVHDDQVDALGLIGQLLDLVHTREPERAKTPRRDRYDDDDDDGSNWKVA